MGQNRAGVLQPKENMACPAALPQTADSRRPISSLESCNQVLEVKVQAATGVMHDVLPLYL